MSTLRHRHRPIRAGLTLLAVVVAASGSNGSRMSGASADGSVWPQQIKSGQSTITMYQRQFDRWDRLNYSAACAEMKNG